MSQYNDPSDIVLACQNGAYSYSTELECLVLDSVAKYPALSNATWSLAASGVKIREAVYNLLSNPATRVIDAVEYGPSYENCIHTLAGVKQLIVTNGYAEPVEP